MESRSDFYLTTAGEYGPLTVPRACRSAGRFRDKVRDDYMLVSIEPPLLLPSCSSMERVSELLIASKWKGLSLFPPSEWPLPVYVIMILDEGIHVSGSFHPEQVRVLAWGTLHRTLADAERAAKGVEHE